MRPEEPVTRIVFKDEAEYFCCGAPDLQDEIPPEPIADILAQVEEDFGRPVAEVFAWFDSNVLGAASLAQTHRARLASRQEVVVKVLRPRIDVRVS